MKPRVQKRVLLFDPDRQGRQQIQTLLTQYASGLQLTTRARAASFIQALQKQHPDAVILGLPIKHHELIEVLLALTANQKSPPLLFLAGEDSTFQFRDGMPHYSKHKDELISLARRLPILVQAARLDSIKIDIKSNVLRGDSPNMSTAIAEYAIETLAGSGIDGMYISIDPFRGRWVIRASTFSEDVINLIETIVAKGGQVAPLIEQVPSEYTGLLSGQESLNKVGLKDLLQVLIPWASDRDLNRLGRVLDQEFVFLAPVVHLDQLHGVLAIGNALHEIEQEAVHRFVSRFAKSLTQAKALDDLQQRAKGLQALQRILVSVSSTLDTSQLMEQVLDLLAEVVAFDGARVYIREEDRIALKAVRGSQRSMRKSSWQPSELGDPNQYFSRTYRAGHPCLRSEVVNHPDLGEPGSKPDWRSWMAVPIRWHGQINGVVTLSSEFEGFFQPLHLEITEMIAQQLGVALENARLLESSYQKAEKLKIVHEIGRSSVSLLDSQLLVFEAAQRVIQIFDYDQVGIFMVEEDILVPEIYLYGKEMRERKGIRHVSLNTGSIFDDAVRTNIPVFIPDLKDHAGLAIIPGTRQARAAMLIPLSIKGAVVGVMLVLSHRKDGIDEDDVEILQVLAAQLGISLVNARLFSEVRAHAAKLEQRVAERTDELRNQKERTEAILRSVADAVMVLDLEGRLVLANPMAQTLLSGPWSEQLYQSVVALQQDDTLEQASWEFGSESFEALASKVDLEARVIGTVIVLRNITRLKELDRLKSQFVATVSHELRTPLANIKLYLSLLRRSSAEPESHYFQTLGSETDRLTLMIEDLLDLSKLDAEHKIEFRSLELNELLQEIIRTQQPICTNKRLDLDYEASGNPLILGNRDRLIQVFTNLMANAIAYTPAGGSIRIRLHPIERVETKAGVVIEVTDSGMGIPADELPYVFDRFYRGRMAQQLKIHGSGLGLAIVRDIIEGHGGKIAVRSDIEQGTCFELWLPIAEGGVMNDG